MNDIKEFLQRGFVLQQKIDEILEQYRNAPAIKEPRFMFAGDEVPCGTMNKTKKADKDSA